MGDIDTLRICALDEWACSQSQFPEFIQIPDLASRMASVVGMRSSEDACYIHSTDIPVTSTAQHGELVVSENVYNDGSRFWRHTTVGPKNR